MPISNDELRDCQHRVTQMLMDTLSIFELIRDNGDNLFGSNFPQLKSAIDEYLNDFIVNTKESGLDHPEAIIFSAELSDFQRVGFYGSQLDVKERQVTEANRSIRDYFTSVNPFNFRRLFKKWVDRINNFLGSLASATRVGEALKELKDCLRDELPDDD